MKPKIKFASFNLTEVSAHESTDIYCLLNEIYLIQIKLLSMAAKKFSETYWLVKCTCISHQFCIP